MKINKISIAGFRGIREQLDIDVPSGFVVICGKNGSGKSTICDAIEFSLSGKIRSGSEMKEKGESFDDYIWWQGNGKLLKKEVIISVKDKNCENYILKRNDIPNDTAIPVDFLFDQDMCPIDPIDQLIRTSIIRDENITKFSVDLQERDRYEFIKNSIGRIGFDQLVEKCKNLASFASNKIIFLESEYQNQRNIISDLTSKLSELQSNIDFEVNSEVAKKIIEEIIGEVPSTQIELVNKGRLKLSEIRVMLDDLLSLSSNINQNVQLIKRFNNEYYSQQNVNLENNIQIINNKISLLNNEVYKLNDEIIEHEKDEPIIRSLAELELQGRQIGLQKGNCPLCGSKISEIEYNNHLDYLAKSIKKANDNISFVIERKNNLLKDIADNKKILIKHESEFIANKSIKEDLQKKIQFIINKGKEFKLVLSDNLDNANKLVSDLIDNLQSKQSELRNAISRLEASDISDSIINLEKNINLAKKESDIISSKLNKARVILEKARTAANTINRISGEIVDEQLSVISPLLTELYTRLRPHIDWREINYRLRGDVRKFLSLTVGNELNPNFMFSSGQRRALGLAFLLTVYLARSWSHFKTIILDDPVQHIDDYRALYLTEVLTSIRKKGHQIICTVEDYDLAQLLCRRLICNSDESGLLVELEYSTELGVKIKSMNDIHPKSNRMILAS